jgi:hypothetical protein
VCEIVVQRLAQMRMVVFSTASPTNTSGHMVEQFLFGISCPARAAM